MKIEKALWVGIVLLFLYCCWLFYRDLTGLNNEYISTMNDKTVYAENGWIKAAEPPNYRTG
jgi:uncharacterized membrane protein